jgi:hypothetical protein
MEAERAMSDRCKHANITTVPDANGALFVTVTCGDCGLSKRRATSAAEIAAIKGAEKPKP